MAKMNANAFLQKDYENETTFRPKKTNPIQTQTNPISKAKNGGQAMLDTRKWQLATNYKILLCLESPAGIIGQEIPPASSCT